MTNQEFYIFATVALSLLILERALHAVISIRRGIKHRAQCKADDAVYAEERAERGEWEAELSVWHEDHPDFV